MKMIEKNSVVHHVTTISQWAAYWLLIIISSLGSVISLFNIPTCFLAPEYMHIFMYMPIVSFVLSIVGIKHNTLMAIMGLVLSIGNAVIIAVVLEFMHAMSPWTSAIRMDLGDAPFDNESSIIFGLASWRADWILCHGWFFIDEGSINVRHWHYPQKIWYRHDPVRERILAADDSGLNFKSRLINKLL